MTKKQQHQQDILQCVEEAIFKYCGRWFRSPAYRVVCRYLNEKNYSTAYGNSWTPANLYQFLFRRGYSGLHDLAKRIENRENQSFSTVTRRI